MKYYILLLVSIFFLSLTPEVVRAQFTHPIDVSEYAIGDVVDVTLHINTGTVSVNAVEAKLTYLPDVLEFVSSDDAHSVIDLWITKPTRADDAHIYFSGLTPLGFKSDDATVSTLSFRVKQPLVTEVVVLDPLVLRNDGLGTALAVTPQTFSLSVAKQVPVTQALLTDTELPERFTPVMVSDPDAFAGQLTVVFNTHDTGSGLSHYEVKEGRYGQYVRADSPYVLKSQSVDRVIYIKAVDKSGNERIEILSPQNGERWYEALDIRMVIVALPALLMLLVLGWYLRRRHRGS
jgi:hypothetical protein